MYPETSNCEKPSLPLPHNSGRRELLVEPERCCRKGEVGRGTSPLPNSNLAGTVLGTYTLIPSELLLALSSGKPECWGAW